MATSLTVQKPRVPGKAMAVVLLMIQKSGEHQLRLVVLSHKNYRVSYIPGGFLAGFPKASSQ